MDLSRRRSLPFLLALLLAVGGATMPADAQEVTTEAAPGSAAEAPEATQLVFFPTAFTTGKHKVNVSIIGVAPWDVLYGLTDRLELGVRTTPPVGAFIFAPEAKLSWPFRWGAAAVHAESGLFLPYLLDTDGVGFAGGGPNVSFGNPRRQVTVGAEAYALFTDQFSMGIVLPYVGGFFRVARRISVGMEVILPGTFHEGSWKLPFGDTALILYGIRILAKEMWGNILFAAPICESCGVLYKKGLVFGVPLLGIGLSL